MNTSDELHVIKWLSQYGALPKEQIMKLLNKTPGETEKILRSLKWDNQIVRVCRGYYGLDPLSRPDQRMVLAVWVLTQFVDVINQRIPADLPRYGWIDPGAGCGPSARVLASGGR